MKTRCALSLLLAALLPACTTVKSTSSGSDYKGVRYASDSIAQPAPPAGPEVDIPAEGPAPVNLSANPAYMPTPLLRASAAGAP